MDLLLWIAGGIAALGVIGAAGWRLLRWGRRISHFFDDWFGEPQRPGVPERPGVMTRLASIEQQVFPNSGTSLYDRVGKLDENTKGNTEAIGDLAERIEHLIGESGT